MATLRVLSAGAAQAVSERVIEAFRGETGTDVIADFGAIGAMKARMTGGEKVDVIILSQAMIEELIGTGMVEAGSRVDLGRVGTGVAVCRGTKAPDVSSASALRVSILGAEKIVCPDPAVATAGKIVVTLMDKLGLSEAVRTRMQYFPNGYAAMRWLAASGEARALGITQDTEILPNQGVTYAGPLPAEFQVRTVYSAGLASGAAEGALAREFMGRYATPAARKMFAAAGFEVERPD